MQKKSYLSPTMKIRPLTSSTDILVGSPAGAKSITLPVSDDTADEYFSKRNNSAWDEENDENETNQ